MNKTKLDKLEEILKETLIEIKQLRAVTEDKETPKPDDPDEKTKKDISLEQVRLILANKATDHREDVKKLISKYGAEKLTQIDPSDYRKIIEEAENI